MSWITLLGSMVAAACLTLAAVHLLAWYAQRRAWASLPFLAALAASASAGCELWMMQAASPAELATALRWLQVPAWGLVVVSVSFIRVHLRAGRRWLAWTVGGLRTVSLLLCFSGSRNPGSHAWMLIGNVSLAFLLVFLGDAALVVWRRGERRLALLMGGGFLVLGTFGSLQSVALLRETVPSPLLGLVICLGLIVGMGSELTRDVLRSARLANELRESEERMTVAMTAGEVGLWTTDATGGIWASGQWRRLFRFGADEIITPGKMLQRLHPDDRERVDRAVRRTIAGGPDYAEEYRMQWPEGEERWISARGRLSPAEPGQPTRMVGASIDITERKRAEAELLKLSRQDREALRVACMGHWEFDVASGLFAFNDQYYALLGTTAAQAGGYLMSAEKFAATYVHPDEASRVRENIQRAIASSDPHFQVQIEGLIVRADGDLRTMTIWFRVEKDAQGRTTKLHGVSQDITERKRAEEALRGSEELLRSIFDSTPDSITVANLDRRIRLCNESTATIYGFPSAGALIGVPLSELVAVEDHPRMMEAEKRVMRHGFVTDVPFTGVKRGGARFAAELSFRVMKDGAGRPMGFVGITRDVTARRVAEEALRASELKHRNLIELTGTGYLIVDRQGRVLDANPEYVRMSGHGGLREILGRSVIEWTAEKVKQQNAEAVAQCARDGFIRNFVTEYATASGGPTFVEVNATVEGEGGSARIVALCRDITARKRAEAEFQQQRDELAHLARVTTLNELSVSLAHELNQPLGMILSNAQAAQRLLRRGPPDLAELNEILEDIVIADHRGADIIRRLRALLKRGELSLQPLSLNDLLGDVLYLVRTDLVHRGVAVECDFAAELPKVLGDRVQLQQLVLNLIMNAADAMAGNQPGTSGLHLKTAPHDGVVRTTVWDQGRGLPADVERLFEPFHTTKRDGLGMGLPICRTIITVHRGRLWAEQHPEGGAMFIFELPVVAGPGS